MQSIKFFTQNFFFSLKRLKNKHKQFFVQLLDFYKKALSASRRGSWTFQWKKSMISRNKIYVNILTKQKLIFYRHQHLTNVFIVCFRIWTFRPERLRLLRKGIQRSMSTLTISSRFSRSNSNLFILHDILHMWITCSLEETSIRKL